MITAEQRRKIFGLQKQHAVDEDDLYSVVEQISGGRSISALTKDQAIQVIDRLARLAGEAKPEQRSNRASDAQLSKIQKLEKDMGWSTDPSRLQGFLRKVVGVDRPIWLTKQQASKVIEALKNMQGRAERRPPPQP
ncbi:regulatory protein GemA [Cohnella nanjingensis]|uniref:Regulatory protein GemA n=1 Tax=Cohnella nanjingensis TaxID=1387779 RepID=A0A7X0VGM3_9BACL|nr:regulatory protein GemA [Cohnella nanjingensis]MBB6673001.1 regulatory protein GemA [Cohnella nanjingensis]